MTVHFIGAGPGAPDLITVRGLKLIQTCPVCLYAGSLVPGAIIAEAPVEALKINTADLSLQAIIEECRKAHEKGQDVARVHSGDPSLYGAIDEQMRALDALGIPYNVIPGVPAFAAAAAALKKELTIPHLNQSLILTRTAVNSSPMPEGETLYNLSQSGATMAIHLSVKNIAQVQAELTPRYGADCPVIVAARISWPDEQVIFGTLADIHEKIAETNINRTAIIFVGRSLGQGVKGHSSLYSESRKA